MKKIIIAVGLALGVLSSQAQNFESGTFFRNATTLSVSNVANITNLLSSTSAGTNTLGTLWTNLNGTQIVVAASTTNRVNLLGSVEIPPTDRNGNYPPLLLAGTNTLNNWQPSPYNLFIKLVGQSGANSAVTFEFTPVYNGNVEATDAASLWIVSVTANTTTAVTLATNVPLYKWMGAKSLRCRAISNADTDASSRVDILNLDLNRWQP